MVRSFVAALALVFATAAARGGDPPIADLFPADTLAYAEATEFAKLAPVLAGWVKGTVLAGGVKAQHDRRDAIRDHKFVPSQADLARLGLLAAPEFHADLARLKGAAVAFTGFNDKHEPRIVLAVLLGDTTALSLYARQLVTADPDTRRVDSVEGVPVCQYRPFGGQSYGPDGNPMPLNASKPPAGPFELTYAFTPGLLVIGSDTAGVKDVVRRYLGKESKPSLAKTDAFRTAERLKGDLLLYARPADAVAALDAANKAAGNAHDPDWLALVKLVGNPKAIPTISGAVRFTPDGWSIDLSASIVPGEKNSILDLLSGEPATTNSALSAGSGLSASLIMPPPAKRAAAVVQFSDAVAKAVGVLGPLPGERFAGTPDVHSLLASVKSIRLEWPARNKSTPRPVFVLECDSSDAAAAWVAATPALVQKSLRSAAQVAPVTEPVNGLTLSALATGNSGLGTVYYTVNGPRLAAGVDRAEVLAALTRPSPAESAPATAAVTVSPLALYDWFGPPAPPPFPVLGTTAIVGGAPQALPTAPAIAIQDVLARVPPVSFSVLRQKDRLTLRLEQSHWGTVRVGVIDLAVAWWDHYLSDSRQPQSSFLPRGFLSDR